MKRIERLATVFAHFKQSDAEWNTAGASSGVSDFNHPNGAYAGINPSYYEPGKFSGTIIGHDGTLGHEALYDSPEEAQADLMSKMDSGVGAKKTNQISTPDPDYEWEQDLMEGSGSDQKSQDIKDINNLLEPAHDNSVDPTNGEQWYEGGYGEHTFSHPSGASGWIDKDYDGGGFHGTIYKNDGSGGNAHYQHYDDLDTGKQHLVSLMNSGVGDVSKGLVDKSKIPVPAPAPVKPKAADDVPYWQTDEYKTRNFRGDPNIKAPGSEPRVLTDAEVSNRTDVGNGSQAISDYNMKQRDPALSIDVDNQFFDHLDHTIRQSKLPSDIVLHRGMKLDGDGPFHKAIDAAEPGNSVRFQGFQSTSSDPEVADNFSYSGYAHKHVFHIHAPAGFPAYKMPYGGDNYGFKSEREYTLPRGTSLRFMDSYKASDGTHHHNVEPILGPGPQKWASMKIAAFVRRSVKPPFVRTSANAWESIAPYHQTFEHPESGMIGHVYPHPQQPGYSVGTIVGTEGKPIFSENYDSPVEARGDIGSMLKAKTFAPGAEAWSQPEGSNDVDSPEAQPPVHEDASTPTPAAAPDPWVKSGPGQKMVYKHPDGAVGMFAPKYGEPGAYHGIMLDHQGQMVHTHSYSSAEDAKSGLAGLMDKGMGADPFLLKVNHPDANPAPSSPWVQDPWSPGSSSYKHESGAKGKIEPDYDGKVSGGIINSGFNGYAHQGTYNSVEEAQADLSAKMDSGMGAGKKWQNAHLPAPDQNAFDVPEPQPASWSSYSNGYHTMTHPSGAIGEVDKTSNWGANPGKFTGTISTTDGEQPHKAIYDSEEEAKADLESKMDAGVGGYKQPGLWDGDAPGKGGKGEPPVPQFDGWNKTWSGDHQYTHPNNAVAVIKQNPTLGGGWHGQIHDPDYKDYPESGSHVPAHQQDYRTLDEAKKHLVQKMDAGVGSSPDEEPEEEEEDEEDNGYGYGHDDDDEDEDDESSNSGDYFYHSPYDGADPEPRMLSDDEISNRGYHGNGAQTFSDYNQHLRDGGATKVDHPFFDSLNHTIRNSPLPYPMELHRGISLNDGNPYRAKLEAAQPGDQLMQKTFQSTSTDESVPNQFGATGEGSHHFHIHAPAGFPAYEMKYSGGNYSQSDEEEYTLAPGTIYTIQDSHVDQDGTTHHNVIPSIGPRPDVPGRPSFTATASFVRSSRRLPSFVRRSA